MKKMTRRAFSSTLMATASAAAAGAARAQDAITASKGFSVPLNLHNLSRSSSYSAPFVSYSHAFADGDIPPGGSVTLKDSNGNPVSVQMDAVALWPSGCTRWAVLSHACAETFSASDSKTYILGGSPVAPNSVLAAGWRNNPAAVLAENSDFKVIYSGFDAGANTYTVSLNKILSTYAQGPAWGGNFPLGGWEYTKKGPVCIEVHGWQYLINDTTGKPQGYVRCDIWVKAWAPTGPFEVDVRTSQPNMWNGISVTSEKYNVKASRWASLCEIKNGPATIKYDGGPKDHRAKTISNSDFDAATNRLTAAVGAFFPQQAVAFASTGALPTGISADTIYWPAYINSGTPNPYLMRSRAFVSAIEQNAPKNWQPNAQVYANVSYVLKDGVIYVCTRSGKTAPGGGPSGDGMNIEDGTAAWQSVSVVFGTLGSGTITAYPVNACFQSTAWHSADQYGDPIWSGSGSRPPIFPGHDFAYLTARSKFTLPYNAAAGSMTSTHPVTLYAPNENAHGIQWALNASGDGATDQRIGHISNNGVASIYNPRDPYYVRATIQGSLCFSQYPYSYMGDEAGGHPFVGNNGTNNSGKPYHGLPPLIPNWCGDNVAGNVGKNLAARGAGWSSWSSANDDQNGYGGQYYFDTSHYPMLQQIAYLKTGRPCFLEQSVYQTSAICFMGWQGKQTLNGTTYYGLINGNRSCQLRGWAWGWRTLCQTMYFMPHDHVFYPVIRDYYNDNASFHAALTATMPPAAAALGILRWADHGSGSPMKGHYSGWMFSFLFYVVCLEAWRGGLTGAAAGANFTTISNYIANQWKLYLPSVDPHAINYIGNYDMLYSPVSGDFTQCYATPSAQLAASVADGSIPGPLYIDYLYDQNGRASRLVANYPENCNWYGNMARGALMMQAKVRPLDTNISEVLAALNAAISNATGISPSTGGIRWYGGGDNCQTFAVF